MDPPIVPSLHLLEEGGEEEGEQGTGLEQGRVEEYLRSSRGGRWWIFVWRYPEESDHTEENKK